MANNSLTEKSKVNSSLQQPSSVGEISAFLKVAKATNPVGAGKIIFALDATMSRQPTWDRAMTHQSAMFDAVNRTGGDAKSGNLSVQLVYFRGYSECKASKWVMNSTALRDLMTSINCRGGQTQISRILSHAVKENGKDRVSALIYIGDALEESVDELCHKAGELGLKNVRCFMFQEGNDGATETGYREIARLTNGAYFKLGPNSAKELAEILGAIAIYAKGGLKALQAEDTQQNRFLLKQLKR